MASATSPARRRSEPPFDAERHNGSKQQAWRRSRKTEEPGRLGGRRHGKNGEDASMELVTQVDDDGDLAFGGQAR
jgi:hypothetical protein